MTRNWWQGSGCGSNPSFVREWRQHHAKRLQRNREDAWDQLRALARISRGWRRVPDRHAWLPSCQQPLPQIALELLHLRRPGVRLGCGLPRYAA